MGRGGGVYSTIAPPHPSRCSLPPPLPSLRLARKTARRPICEWSAQLPIKRRRPLLGSALLAPALLLVSSGCVATGKRLTSVAVWRDLTEERHCVRTPSLRLAINARAHTQTHRDRHTTHGTHVTASAKSWMHTALDSART